MGFQFKRTFCSKIFATGPSKLGNVVCQMKNQTESRKNQGDHILQSKLARITEPSLKLYGETIKVLIIGINFIFAVIEMTVYIFGDSPSKCCKSPQNCPKMIEFSKITFFVGTNFRELCQKPRNLRKLIPIRYPQVKFLAITFDSQLTFRKHFEDILDRCNTRYHRLKLLAHKKWGPIPSTIIQIYKQCVRPIFE